MTDISLSTVYLRDVIDDPKRFSYQGFSHSAELITCIKINTVLLAHMLMLLSEVTYNELQ